MKNQRISMPSNKSKQTVTVISDESDADNSVVLVSPGIVPIMKPSKKVQQFERLWLSRGKGKLLDIAALLHPNVEKATSDKEVESDSSEASYRTTVHSKIQGKSKVPVFGFFPDSNIHSVSEDSSAWGINDLTVPSTPKGGSRTTASAEEHLPTPRHMPRIPKPSACAKYQQLETPTTALIEKLDKLHACHNETPSPNGYAFSCAPSAERTLADDLCSLLALVESPILPTVLLSLKRIVPRKVVLYSASSESRELCALTDTKDDLLSPSTALNHHAPCVKFEDDGDKDDLGLVSMQVADGTSRRKRLHNGKQPEVDVPLDISDEEGHVAPSKSSPEWDKSALSRLSAPAGNKSLLVHHEYVTTLFLYLFGLLTLTPTPLKSISDQKEKAKLTSDNKYCLLELDDEEQEGDKELLEQPIPSCPFLDEDDIHPRLHDMFQNLP
ncbi:hypothetical protein Moror_12943 [Moniliophthora roreri MCA 2997]|uniref:Uncharacterized protein n=1 Tax=Moniliophthora roreri (strain MCA 2997) TaxID=1381753 RepID=V2XN52_MONRO|nr:hypothetical protein Moror_12943 [Moniliophthora roreri MCA 2997]